MNQNSSTYSTFAVSLLKNSRLNRGVLNAIFILSVAVLLFISITSYRQVNNLITDSQWVNHTHRVIQSVESTLYGMVDAESRQRAYLLTGASQLLADIDVIKTTLTAELNKLDRLTKDNAEQNQRVKQYIHLIDERLTLLNQVMQLKTGEGMTTPFAVSLMNQSQDFSNRVKSMGQEIKAVESILLRERNATVLENANITSFILICGSLLSMLSLIVAFILANIELLTRKQTEDHNHHIRLRLKKIIESASDMIAAYDKEERLIIFNEAYQREFKRLFDKPLTLHMSLEEALSDVPEQKSVMAEQWKQSLHGNEGLTNAEFMNGAEKNIYEMSSSLIQDEDNEINGVVHSIRNITKRVQEHTELQRSYEQLAAGMKELQDKNQQITLLVEMSDIMLACNTEEELSVVMAKYAERLLTFSGGYLFIMHPSKNYLEKACNWGNPATHEVTFTPDQCWAIRLGRIHQGSSSLHDLMCTHIKAVDNPSRVLCVPLMAQNDIYGLLYMEVSPGIAPLADENQRLLITAFAELTALALANVRLRENLRYQSIRDPLTGLYNRRYLEDFLFKQLHQAERSKSSFAVLMLDLDHFKKINDTYGHDAGDSVLKELGQILYEDIRLGDVAARFGGEEFIVMLYDIDEEAALERAEALRNHVATVRPKYGAQQVGHITVSIGVAMYPDNGKTPPQLIEAADKALYLAKSRGRNRVVMYSDREDEKAGPTQKSQA
ncbi:diguanylate cyclase [Legionella sp. MW5194]|uniref:sensor domain-containing diguanylate cyclase n=1 Tax=Legionella sp. MW5194 TaxID=2662448 RepID=UPI00193E3692|nr:diguanylate cyclase [Legionella sp. MW5194]QRN03029.1 diguanylate cyclase [Legionella sp. MW5194]